MKDDQWWERCVYVHVKRVSPLDILGQRLAHEPVGQKPHDRGWHDSSEQKVHNNYVNDEVNGLEKSQVEQEHKTERSD